MRTLYRDIQALILSGVPIEGEAGVGYALKPGFALPPLMFNSDELIAILLGGQMVKAWTDPILAQAADSALAKVRAILPPALLAQAQSLPYRVPVPDYQDKEQLHHNQLRQACEKRQKIEMTYKDAKDSASQRLIWPLALVFWGQNWTLLTWCELRQDYRNFRLDRIQQITLLSEHYPKLKQPSLTHYLEDIIGVSAALF